MNEQDKSWVYYGSETEVELERPLDSEEPERIEEPSMGQRLDVFKKELEHLINCHSIENLCDMPDYMLAEHLCNYLGVLANTVRQRDQWFGFEPFGGDDRVLERQAFTFPVTDPTDTGFYIEHHLGCRTVNLEFLEADGTPIVAGLMQISGDENVTIITLNDRMPRLAQIRVLKGTR